LVSLGELGRQWVGDVSALPADEIAPATDGRSRYSPCRASSTGTMANALKFHAVVSGKTLSLPDLGAFEGKRVEVIVVEDEGLPALPPQPPQRRPLGLLRGRLVVPDDFDAPLPPDLQKYFDGDGDGR
jgi:hypothetical protein